MKQHLSRRGLLKGSAIALGGAGIADKRGEAAASGKDPSKSPVYFTRDISVAGLLRIYAKINGGLRGKVAIKLHSGEPKGPNLLPVELI
jgi:hypothetical protein